MLSKQDIYRAIEEIATHAENCDPQTVVESFYDRNIKKHLTNPNNQIIQGRRGTGKTHILRVLQVEMESQNQHCIYFDCRQAGSAHSIADESLPVNHRLIQLLRDFISCLSRDLLAYYNEPTYTYLTDDPAKEFLYEQIDELITHLHKECYTLGVTHNQYSTTQTSGKRLLKKNESLATMSASFSPAATVGFNTSEGMESERENSATQNIAGQGFERVRYPDVSDCLQQLTTITKTRFVILIDEWSALPLDVQVHFAEFLRRVMIPCQSITLKIAVVRGRTRYCQKKDGIIYGFEIGAEIDIKLDLDERYMYDRNPRTVTKTLYRILAHHLASKGIIDKNEDGNLLRTLFSDEKCTVLLAKASEGNPRDFIHILCKCIIEMDFSEKAGAKITSETVYNASQAWFEQDKVTALTETQKNFLTQLFTHVVTEHKNRGFVVDNVYVDTPLIGSLIDARILHILQTGKIIPTISKKRLAVLVLDFGAYGQELRVGERINFFVADINPQKNEYERWIFPSLSTISKDECISLDSYRKFRMCYLSPALISLFTDIS